MYRNKHLNWPLERSEFHSLEMKLSEAQITILKLETQLKQALSTSTPAKTPSLKLDIETQTDTIHGVEIGSQTEPSTVRNKESSKISISLSSAPKAYA